MAAYLAAYGLAERSLPVVDGDSPGVPDGLWLEWGGEVDDIRCSLGGGGRWELQAKRHCDWDVACFSKVVAQWVAAVRSRQYSEMDRFVLVAGRVSGPLRKLQEAFRRLRCNSQAELLSDEREALRRFRDQAATEGWSDVFERVVASGMILELEVESASQAGFRDAANALDGVVVALGSGPSAMNALSRFFHTEAARSGSSVSSDWLRVLDEADIPPGPWSERARAGAARAIASYRRRLIKRKDMLDVDLLGGGVPAMKVSDLLGTFEVDLPNPEDESRPNTPDLADLARRWRRFGIVGLPGSGKTTALEQLAAAWADDPDAPVPILVRLHRLVADVRSRQSLQIEDWCRFGDEVTPDIIPVLAHRLRHGGGALFLDGLDECRDQQGRVATAIRAVADELSGDTSIIFSVREVASTAAKSTGLPLTKLREPRQLTNVMSEVLKHVVETDPGAVDDLDAQTHWMKVSQSLHADVWAVPLFAVLLAVHAARARSSDLPATRAEALVAAIEDSVLRWERDKAHDPSAWDPDLEPRMLLDAFVLIGHGLMRGPMNVDECRNMIASSLAEPWGLAPSRSVAIADDILAWWNERVGAFVVEDAQLKTRLRMFSEIGDAMWAARGSPDLRRQWLHQALQDPEKHHEPALLAAGLNADLGDELVATAETPAAVLLAADVVVQGVMPSGGALGLLLQRLGAFFKDPPDEPPLEETDDLATLAARLADRRTESDGPGWEFGYRLATLPLPRSLRSERNSFLSHTSGTERRAVALALAAAADCAFDGRGPNEHEHDVLRSVLELPLPPREPPRQRRSRLDPIEISSGPPVVTGRGEAAIAAIELVGLTPTTADAASELSERVWAGVSDRLRSAIRAAGFSDALHRATETASFARTHKKILGSDPHLHTRFVLSMVADLSNGPASWWEPWREWRLDAVAALFEVLNEGPRPLGAGPAAVEEGPELVSRLATMASGATGFPLAVVVAECRRALRMLEEDALSTSVLLHVPSDPLRMSPPKLPLVQDEDLPDLTSCLRSRNPVLFWPAAHWLDRARRPELLNVFWDALPEMWGSHRYLVAEWLPKVSGRTDVYNRWINEDDPIRRVVASTKIAMSATAIREIVPLLRDSDMMVRVGALEGLVEGNRDLLDEAARIALDEPASAWTCVTCGSLESMEGWNCTKCSRGARRELEEEVVRLTNAAADSSNHS